jgi:hypothetical protein
LTGAAARHVARAPVAQVCLMLCRVSGEVSEGFGTARMQMRSGSRKAAAGGIGGLHTKWNGFQRAGNGHLTDRTPMSI